MDLHNWRLGFKVESEQYWMCMKREQWREKFLYAIVKLMTSSLNI